MKKIILFCFMVLFLVNANAQVVVHEDVHFDYYQSASVNDFTNHFSSNDSLYQVSNNGISGGCLMTVDSINWGNDRAVYCSKYKPATGDTTYTSISFKYDTVGTQRGTFQRAISIWLIPYADFNHYIVASVTGNKKLELLTYSWNNNPYPNLALIHRHWYGYLLKTAFVGGTSHTIYVKAEVFDLGLSGTAAPINVNSSSGTFNDNILDADTSIAVSISGSTRGGAIYLDDYSFEGREGFTNCINSPIGISNEDVSNSFSIYPIPASHTVFVERNYPNDENIRIVIYDLMGKKLKEINSSEKKIGVDISSLSEGVYFLKGFTTKNLWTTKIIVSN